MPARAVWKALKHLYPNARGDQDYEIVDAGTGPRIAVWRLPGNPPTDAEIDAAIIAYDQADTTRRQREAQLLSDVTAVVQGAVGVHFNSLTAAQQRAVLILMAYRLGLLDLDGKIRL